ncbi:hypothetical protein CTAYLR_001847 [Chrysophaeum taylorii]|uniref:Uncharacterized protein n=1 Tax=Chrysophaeum taylorii TaxID=2483200 RepID=A0AAD7UAG7_9STRA|nr:hypothetical protein CTAYLR_001847 [Chrysophaeum taylorii]
MLVFVRRAMRCRAVVLVQARHRSGRAWHEPPVLWPSTAAFRDEELRILGEFVDVAAAMDDRQDSDATGELLAAAVAEAAGHEDQTTALLGGWVERLTAAETALDVGEWADATACVRLALARRYATHLAASLLPADAARSVARRAGTPTRWWPIETAPPATVQFDKVEAALRASTRGDLAQRLVAHCAIEEDDDGLLDTAAAVRTVLALAMPVGPALADAHDRLVSPRLPQRAKRRVRRQKRDARHVLATTYPFHRLDIRTKARCVADWADKAKTKQFGEPAPLFSAAWLLGRGVRTVTYLDSDQLAHGIKEFFPELLTLGRTSARNLLDRRTEHWFAVEENRTTQYAVAAFCVGCGLIDFAIIEA